MAAPSSTIAVPSLSVSSLRSVKILGARVHGPTLGEAVQIIESWIAEPSGTCRMTVTTGFHGLWVGHQEPAFRDILNAADLFCPDGIAPVWLSRLHGRPLPARVCGSDLMEALLLRSQQTGYRSFLYGDTEETLSALKARLKSRFPGISVGSLSPPFRPLDEAEEAAHIEIINASGADLLWVGLGCPKQEKFLARNRSRLTIPVAIGVGAAFRFHAGLVSRAPEWVGNAGLEWAWRLAAEPGKMWRRDMTDGPRFIVAALADAARMRWRSLHHEPEAL